MGKEDRAVKAFQRSFSKIILPLFLFVFCACCLAIELAVPFAKLGFFNFTNSMPKGLYVICRSPVTEGSFVVVPSSRVKSFGEKLPRYLLKMVLPYHGETVTINQAGLSFDGKLVAARIKSIGLTFNSTLTAGQALILGKSERSFDSRYFGPVAISDLTPVRPCITW